VAERSTPSVTCTGVGTDATIEDAPALVDVDGDAATLADGVGATGSTSHQSWKWPAWPCGAK
jgi:hypothetical protein